MSSEAITKNDLKAVLDTIMPLPVETKYSIVSAGSASTSFPANSGTWVTINPTLSATQKIIGITGWYLNGIGNCYLYNYRLTNARDGAQIAVYNANSSAKTGTVAVDFIVAEETFKTTQGMVDYIVEEGTNTGWKYRKWNNGRIEGWYTASTQVAADQSYGNALYYHSYPSSWSYPSTLFLTVDNVQVQAQTGNGFWWIQPHALNAPYIPFYAISNQNTSTTLTINGYIVGTWK